MEFSNRLSGQYVSLLEFNHTHISQLMSAATDTSIWLFNKSSSQDLSQFLNGYIETLIKEHQSKTHFVYVVIDNLSQKIIGSTRFYDISMSDKKLAIGFTWYNPRYWSTMVNPETKFLLLKYVFERLEFNRVEFHIDTRNQRSINAVTKLGAVKEGVLRNHKIVQGDFVRDTMIFSIINNQYPKIKQALIDRLETTS